MKAQITLKSGDKMIKDFYKLQKMIWIEFMEKNKTNHKMTKRVDLSSKAKRIIEKVRVKTKASIIENDGNLKKYPINLIL